MWLGFLNYYFLFKVAIENQYQIREISWFIAVLFIDCDMYLIIKYFSWDKQFLWLVVFLYFFVFLCWFFFFSFLFLVLFVLFFVVGLLSCDCFLMCTSVCTECGQIKRMWHYSMQDWGWGVACSTYWLGWVLLPPLLLWIISILTMLLIPEQAGEYRVKHILNWDILYAGDLKPFPT